MSSLVFMTSRMCGDCGTRPISCRHLQSTQPPHASVAGSIYILVVDCSSANTCSGISYKVEPDGVQRVPYSFVNGAWSRKCVDPFGLQRMDDLRRASFALLAWHRGRGKQSTPRPLTAETAIRTASESKHTPMFGRNPSQRVLVERDDI